MDGIERKPMKANVLGTEYKIITDDSIITQGVDGLCKRYDKEIIIRSKGEMLGSDDSEEVKDIRYKEVLRHELVHAFFEESGLDDYSNNEQLVNWLATQFPKIMKAFIEADCVGLPGFRLDESHFVVQDIKPSQKIGSEKDIENIKKHMKGGAKCLQ